MSQEMRKEHTHKEIMVILGGLMTGMLLAALDQTIVSTALRNIVDEFHGLNHYTWVVTAYLLTSTAATPLYGKISDLYGRRVVFQFATVTFLIGSALAGASQNMGQLIATRALQGLGAGGLMALTFVIIGDIVPPRERGRYQGYFGAVWGLSSVAGPLLGGYFSDHAKIRSAGPGEAPDQTRLHRIGILELVHQYEIKALVKRLAHRRIRKRPIGAPLQVIEIQRAPALARSPFRKKPVKPTFSGCK